MTPEVFEELKMLEEQIRELRLRKLGILMSIVENEDELVDVRTPDEFARVFIRQFMKTIMAFASGEEDYFAKILDVYSHEVIDFTTIVYLSIKHPVILVGEEDEFVMAPGEYILMYEEVESIYGPLASNPRLYAITGGRWTLSDFSEYFEVEEKFLKKLIQIRREQFYGEKNPGLIPIIYGKIKGSSIVFNVFD